jgi:hypothetical protein
MPIDVDFESWDIEHVIPRAMFINRRDADTDENMKPAHHHTCHKSKTVDDVKKIARAKSIEDKRKGFKVSRYPPIPGSKRSGLRKRMDGTVERREK